MVKGYLPLVHRVVSQLARRLPSNVERDDLLAAGLCGLVDSLQRNGGNAGAGFEMYARMRIRGAVVDELRAQDWLSRRARARSDAQFAEDGGGAFLVSLGEVTPGEESAYLAHMERPDEALEASRLRHALMEALEKLPERDRRILGLIYFEGLRLREIGAALGVSEPRVSQLHARALDRLRVLLDRAA